MAELFLWVYKCCTDSQIFVELSDKIILSFVDSSVI